jgi:hypothetical protein
LGRRRHLWRRGWEGAAAGRKPGYWRSRGDRPCLRLGEGSFRNVRGRVRDWVWETVGSARHCIAGRGDPGAAAEGACSRSGSTEQGHTWPETRWVWLRLSVVRKGTSALKMFRYGFAQRGSPFRRCREGGRRWEPSTRPGSDVIGLPARAPRTCTKQQGNSQNQDR